MVIVTKFIARHEIRPLRRYISLKDIIDGCKKVIKNISTEIRLPNMPSDFRFFKVRIGARDKARMIVFMVLDNKKIIPILIRLKKDKVMGMNMSANNQTVVDQVTKNLNAIIQDIRKKEYEEFDIWNET